MYFERDYAFFWLIGRNISAVAPLRLGFYERLARSMHQVVCPVGLERVFGSV